MLFFDGPVPEALLLNRAREQLKVRVIADSGHWFAIEPGYLGCDDQSEWGVTWLQSSTSDQKAMPVTANTHNSTFASDADLPGLAFLEGENCGFFCPLVTGADFSFAIRYCPGESDPRTLLTLNAADQDNYLYLSHRDAEISLKDQRNTVDVTQPAPASGQDEVLIVAGYSKGRLFLRIQDGAVVQSRDAADLASTDTATLFIGVRSHRKKLVKTLGQFILRDVICWPGTNILDPQDPRSLLALDAFHNGEM